MWKNLPDSYLCSNGKEQSPIDLKSDAKIGDVTLKLTPGSYKDYTDATIVKKETTIAFSFSEGEIKQIFDNHFESEYVPRWVHLHAPSEHSIDGTHMDLELDFAHLSSNGKNIGAIIGVLFDRVKGGNKDNLFIE